MVLSRFQFSNPVLRKIEFVTNSDFSRDKKIVMPINLQTEVNFLSNQELEAIVEVTVCVGARDDSAPFYAEATESAKFRWEEGVFSESQVEKLLHQNATALLVSYIRPVLANLTAASQFPTYNLPYLDLTVQQEVENEEET